MHSIWTKKDFLKCMRYELVPALPMTESDEDFGVLGLVNYRLNIDSNKEGLHHPDCLYLSWDKKNNKWNGRSKLSEIFETLYKQKVGYSKDAETDKSRIVSSDTIFNCWTYLKFYVSTKMDIDLKAVNEEYINDNYAEIFSNFDELKLFNKLADYHHCLANFMPCPQGYNGSPGHDGKGNWFKDKDLPDLYYRRCKKDFPEIYKWINDNEAKYSLSFFDTYKTMFDPFSNSEININDIIDSVKNAINAIECRAESLVKISH